MAHIQTNVSKFYSKLEEFWNTGKYTDVTVKCRNESFRCHRLALAATCKFFDSMFGGNFKERNMEIVSLTEIDATMFEQVLKFIYTGDAVVNSDNLCSLLQASEFLNLPGIEDICLQFLQKDRLTFQNAFDVFVCLFYKEEYNNRLMCALYCQMV